MPNDAVLDPAVHHLSVKDRFNRENPAVHGHYTHDAAMISCLHDAHYFWRQGHQTFSGFTKARERPQKRGRVGEVGGRSRTETKKKTEDEWKTNNKGEGKKKKKTKKQGSGDETGDTQTKKKKQGLYREGEKGRAAT